MDAEASSPALRKRKNNCKFCQCHQNPKIDISIPGLGRLYDANYGTGYKTIWLITVVLCAGACIYFTVDRLELFFEGPVTTKLFIIRNHKVQFPDFSICYNGQSDYLSVLKNDLITECNNSGISDCPIESMPLPQLNLSVSNLWSEDYVDYDIQVESMNSTNTSYTVSTVETAFGSCLVIRHVEEIPYFSARTQLIVDIFLNFKMLDDFIFIPHGMPTNDDLEFDLIHHESEFLNRGYITQFRIKERSFEMKNVSSAFCYDGVYERKRVKNCAMSLLPETTCRLPYMPESFPECQTLNDARTSAHVTVEILESLLHEENCSIRQICKETIYALSMDYIHKAADETITTMILKFVDDTTLGTKEYFYYSLPDLISDLFAYWGFFLCLSALVFVEIFDYILRKLCYLCYSACSRKILMNFAVKEPKAQV